MSEARVTRPKVIYSLSQWALLTESVAASHPRTVCSIADAKAVNLQLAQLKNDKDRFDIFVAERRNIVVEVEKVMFSLNISPQFPNSTKNKEFVTKCEQSTSLRATRLRREAEAAREARNQRYEFGTVIGYHRSSRCRFQGFFND
jgi:hypothetical protein